MSRISPNLLLCISLTFIMLQARVAAQENASDSTQDLAHPPAPPISPQIERIIIPTGTRLALVLQNAINTRAAKVGDSAYFQIVFPVALDDRIVIPAGTLARGEVVSVKRPGRLKGRAELQLQITSLVFGNGYVVPLAAVPRSIDNDEKDNVADNGSIKGGSRTAQDVSNMGTATLTGLAVGTYGGIVGAVATGSAHAFGAGIAAGGAGGLLAGLMVLALTRGPEVELRRGTILDANFDRPLVLDAAHLPPGNSAAPIVSFPSPDPRADRNARKHCRRGLWGSPCF